MIRNVVLDIGGVLVDYHTADYYTQKGYSEEMALRLAQATMYSPYWEQNDIGLMPYDWILGKMKALDPELSADIDACLASQTDIVTRRAESKDWIEQIRAWGYRTLVLSNFSFPALEGCRKAMDFLGENLGGSGREGEYGVISEGIISCMDHVVKPYPEIYALLLTRYGLKAEETVFVDDTPKNLPGAEYYGIRTILFDSREQVLEELERMKVPD